MISIAPLSLEELWAINDYLAELHALARPDLLGDDIDAGAQAEHKSRVLAVENQITSGQEDFARSGNSRRRARHLDRLGYDPTYLNFFCLYPLGWLFRWCVRVPVNRVDRVRQLEMKKDRQGNCVNDPFFIHKSLLFDLNSFKPKSKLG